jgi:hypothetical protein
MAAHNSECHHFIRDETVSLTDDVSHYRKNF